MSKKWPKLAAVASALAIGLTLFLNLNVNAEDSIQKAARINKGCLRCHGAQGLKTTFQGEKTPVSLYVDEQKYLTSMHGTMPCVYCHTNIKDYPHTTALTERKAFLNQVNGECKRCHKDISPNYAKSVHAQNNPKLGTVNSNCSDCHTSHSIYKKEDTRSSVNHNRVIQTCSECHKEIEESYMESFHGKSVYLGGKEAASCVSCHGSHTILGPEDSSSTVAKSNVPNTCAKCHLTPLKNFSKGVEHFSLKPKGTGAPMFWTLEFFTWLTISVVTMLIIHMELELYRKYKNACKTEDEN